jgi:hypothetical protein
MDLKAQYNYWGTTNLDSVEMVIVHQPDDPSLGFVDYIPILNPLGSGELPQQSETQKVILNIFPNPMQKEGYIQLNKNLMVGKSIRYEILNLRGNAIRKGNVIAENALVRIDVSTIEAGVYFLKVKSGARMEIRTFVISR